MKRILSFISLIPALMIAVVSCSKNEGTEDNGLSELEKEVAAAIEKYYVCQSIYRPLAGLDILPEGWEIMEFRPAIGTVADEAKPFERSVIVGSYEGAEQYFLNITTDEHTVGSGSGWTWSYEGVGSMTFTKVGSADCYAYADVALVQMPTLTRINFVPETAVGDNAKFDGTPYYGAGDVMMDKDGVYWICVRPSAGPLRKEYAYFVTFDLNQKNYKTYKQDVYNVDEDGRKTREKLSCSGNWIYGTGLVEERIAVAAAHTLSRLRYENSDATRLIMENILNKTGLDLKRVMDESRAFVYAGPSSTSNSNLQVKYQQPAFIFYTQSDDGKTWNETIKKALPKYLYRDCRMPYSVTVTHDPTMQYYLFGKVKSISQNPYTIGDYTITWNINLTDYAKNGEDCIVLRQKRVTDKGKKSSDFTETIWRCPVDQRWDYWGSFETTKRTLVDKGDDEFEGKPVTDLYE